MFRKNVAGQVIHFQGVDSATGGIKSGVTWTVRRCIDGTFAAGGGTVTEDGSTGWYKYAMSQADTNGNNIGFNFTGTGAIPQTVNIVTTAADPTDAVRLGLTALPNANAEAAGGLYTRGTGAGQINQPANGQVDANAVRLGGTTQTGRDIGASVLLSSGTGAGELDFTAGVVKANLVQILATVLTETSGQIAAAFKKFFDKASPTGTVNSLPDAVAGAASGLALVGSDVGTATSVSGSVGSVTAGVTVTTNNDKTGYGLSSAAIQAIWDALTSALTTAGSIGKWILDKLDVVVSTRLASASYTAPLDAAGTRSAVGLASANLDTQLSAIDDFLDTEITAIKAKTDNLPASPAATDDIPTAAQVADQVWSTLTDVDVPFPSNTTIVDNFNRANQGPPPSTEWTNGFAGGFGGIPEPGHEIVDNQLANTFNDVAQNWRNDAEAGPDCDWFITVTDATGLTFVGVAARLTEIDGFTSNGYVVQVNSSGSGNDRIYTIWRIDAGDLTMLATDSEVGLGSMTGDKYGIRCLGNNIQLWADTGEGWRKRLSAVDSAHRGAGFPGIVTEISSQSRLDDFGGGSIIFPASGSLQFNAGAIADAVWDEDIVTEHQTAGSAGKKLSQALVLYEGN